MKYAYLIFDVDDTLLDFEYAYNMGQAAVAQKLKVPFTNEYREIYNLCGWKAWEEYNLSKTDTIDVQNNYHKYYYQYLMRHFEYLGRKLKIDANNDLVRFYLNIIASSVKTMEDDTLQIYSELSLRHKNIIATNGIATVQKKRLKKFLPFTSAVFISQEMQKIKPSLAFYESILEAINCEPKDCLMIGDSLSNDITGASHMGIDTCWYNKNKKDLINNVKPDYIITKISDLISMGL